MYTDMAADICASFVDLILIMIPDRFTKYKTFELLIVFVAILQQFLHGS